MIKNSPTAAVFIKQVSNYSTTTNEDQLAVEEPLQIQLAYCDNGNYVQKNISVTMRTPGNDEALALGFLFTEGIIKNIEDVKEIKHTDFDKNVICITLHETAAPFLQNTERNFYSTSSCGVCGKASIYAIKTVTAVNTGDDGLVVEPLVFYTLERTLKEQQAVFKSTGGLHASALFTLQGNFILLKEDVGRHNALDKLIGTVLLSRQDVLSNSILLLSGRISFELVQKAAMAGIKIIAAIGAPSSLAVGLANDCGITVVGFLRDSRFNIYSAAQRVAHNYST